MIERPTERLRYVVRHIPIQEHDQNGNRVTIGVRTDHVLQQLWKMIPEEGPVIRQWRDVPIEEESNDDLVANP